MRIAQGGKFEHGFFSGFVSSLGGSAMMKYGGNMGIETKIALSAAPIAIGGGIAEAIGGGKFVNGAITGAYVVLFNHLAHQGGGGGEPTKEDGGYVKGGRKAALEFMEKTAVRENVEISVYELENGEFFVNPWEGNSIDESHQSFEVRSDGIYHDDSKIVSQYHFGPTTQSGYQSIAGYNDMQFAQRYNVNVYHISSKYVYKFSPQDLWLWSPKPKVFMTKDQFYNF